MTPFNKELVILFFVGLLGCTTTPIQAPTRYLDVPAAPLVAEYTDSTKDVDYDGLMAYVDALESYQVTVSEHRDAVLRKYFKHPLPKTEKDTCINLYYRDKIDLDSPPDIDDLDPDQTIDALTTYIEQLHSQVREYNAAIARTNEIQSAICNK